MFDRIVIVSGPRAGKSWLAREIHRETGAPVFCGDPRSMVKDVEPGVTYLPEGLGMGSDSSQWIVDNWLTMPGPWILEGHVMARVLRKWMSVVDESTVDPSAPFPCDKVIVFKNQRHDCDLKRGQVAMHKSVMTVWSEIDLYYEPITEER